MTSIGLYAVYSVFNYVWLNFWHTLTAMSWNSSPASETMSLRRNIGQSGSVLRLNSHLFRYEDLICDGMFLLRVKRRQTLDIMMHNKIYCTQPTDESPFMTHLWTLNFGYIMLFLINTVKFSATASTAGLRERRVRNDLHYNIKLQQCEIHSLRRRGVKFKRAPWEHLAGLDSGGIVLTQPCQYTWAEH